MVAAAALACRMDVGSMNRMPGEVPRIGRAAADPGYATNHGSVEQTLRQGQVISFVGGEESDILHAAAEWMLEHPYAVIIAISWQNFITSEAEEREHGPRHRMQMVVDPG